LVMVMMMLAFVSPGLTTTVQGVVPAFNAHSSKHACMESARGILHLYWCGDKIVAPKKFGRACVVGIPHTQKRGVLVCALSKMGLESWTKERLIKWYRHAFSYDLKAAPEVAIVDLMQFLKAIPDDIITLNDLVGFYVSIVLALFNKYPSLTHIVVCVDRAGVHSPVKAMVTHTKRYKGVDVLDPAKGPYLPLKGIEPIPTPWINFAASGANMRRELYPRIFNAFMDGNLVLGPGKSIILHGFPGRSQSVRVRATYTGNGTGDSGGYAEQVQRWVGHELPISAEDEARDPDLYNRVYFVQHVAPCQQYPRGMMRRVEWKEAKNKIGEADLAIVHYDHHFKDKTQLLIINDGDALPITLLYASERHLANNTFRNRQFIRLPYKKTKNNEFFEEGNVPKYQYVDVNQLYCDVNNDKRFLKAGVQHRILTMVFLLIMSGTDFFKNYMKGIGAEKGIWPTFFSKLELFSHLVQMPKGLPANTRCQRDIVLDEDAFRQLVHYCYLNKFGKSARKLCKKGEPFTHEVLARKVNSGKRAQKDPEWGYPSRQKIRVWGRQVLWNALYWKNGPMGVIYSPDPFERYDELPYYGYERDPENNKPIMAQHVSVRQKPVDETMAQHLLRNREVFRMRKRRHQATEDVERVTEKQREVVEEFGDFAAMLN